ncbi:hypothetical protein CROQUDRAFT_661920 [Cronartium quercuum f. sp. fusiforme G11]|uniref:Uncharacterized protein n=1 Tax=Cronartium quercuum f. sp. fusiforme G11 TaxID=708437 RepID=A0A9P6T8T5_9BASI|nr:hypothetical protein CROQUDRAFT_661920 [Cronartium quercuum f. sp. fusiforme G11]
MCNYKIYSTIPAYIKCSHSHSVYLGVMAVQHSTDKFLCPLRQRFGRFSEDDETVWRLPA